MAIEDATGVIEHRKEDIYTKVNQAMTAVTNQTGQDTPRAYGASFAGMNQRNLTLFEGAVDTYRGEIQDIINKLQNQLDAIKQAFRGDNLVARVNIFITAIKELLNSYVATIDQEKLLVQDANQNWQAAQRKIGENAATDAQAIRTAAQGVTLN